MNIPVLDDAHHGSGDAHIDRLSHLGQEVLLNLETPLPDAPASVHQEGQVHLTVCTTYHRNDNKNETESTFIELFTTATEQHSIDSLSCGDNRPLTNSDIGSNLLPGVDVNNVCNSKMNELCRAIESKCSSEFLVGRYMQYVLVTSL